MYCKTCRNLINLDYQYCEICGTELVDENLISESKIKRKFKKIQEACSIEDYKKSNKLLRNLISKKKNNSLYLFWLAYTYHQLGNSEKASKYYKKSLNINPDFLPAKIWKGLLECQSTGNTSKEFFRNLVDENPSNPLYKDFLEEVENVSTYSNDLEEIIINQPSNEKIQPKKRNSKISKYLRKDPNRDYDKDLEESNIELKNNPNNIDLLNKKTDILIQLERYEEALETSNSILNLDKKNLDAIFSKIWALNHLNDYGEIVEFSKDIDFNSIDNISKRDIYYSIAHAYIILGPNDKAAEYLLKTANCSDDPEAEMNEVLKWNMEDLPYPKSINVFDEILKLEKDNVSALVFKADEYIGRDFELAEKNYKLALEYNPDSYNALLGLKFLYKNDGRDKEAEELDKKLYKFNRELFSKALWDMDRIRAFLHIEELNKKYENEKN